MEKSIFSTEYTVFLKHLKATRKKAGVTQTKLAEMLGQTQSFISKVERGERRLDIVELYAFCQVMNISLSKFVDQFDNLLKKY